MKEIVVFVSDDGKEFHSKEKCEEYGMLYKPEDCFTYMNELPEKFTQMSLFGE